MAKTSPEEIRKIAEYRGQDIILSKMELREFIKEAQTFSNRTTIIDLIIKKYGKVKTIRKKEEMTLSGFELSASSLSESLSSEERTMPNLDLKPLMNSAAKFFEAEVIKPSLIREEETTRHFLRNKNFDLNSKKEVLNFFNGVSHPKPFDLNRVAELFATKLSGKPMENNVDINDRLTSFVSEVELIEKDLIDTMTAQVVNAIAFIGFVEVLSRKKEDIIKDESQAEKGGKTALEYIEKINLEKQAAETLKGRKFSVVNVGSEAVGTIIEQKINEKIQSQGFITNKDIEEILAYALKNDPILVERFKSKKNKKMSSTARAQKLMSASGSGQILKVADLKATLDGRDMYIDVKLSKEQGGRYTPSSGINTTIDQVFKSMESPINEEFISRLNKVMSFILFLAYKGLLTNGDFENKEFTKLLTYGILGSNEFVRKYRKTIEEELMKQNSSKLNFTQPDFLLTSGGYIWYSDFFRLIYNIYFLQEGGSKASIAFKNETTSKINKKGELVISNPEYANLLNPLLELRERADTYEDFKKILKDNNLEYLEKYLKTFISANVNLKIDITNIYRKLSELK